MSRHNLNLFELNDVQFLNAIRVIIGLEPFDYRKRQASWPKPIPRVGILPNNKTLSVNDVHAQLIAGIYGHV